MWQVLGLTWLLLAVAGDPPRPLDSGAATVLDDSVELSRPAAGVLRLTRPGPPRAAVLLGELTVPDGPLGLRAEVRCGGLWNRDAQVRLAWLAEDGVELGSVVTPPVYRTADWSPVVVYGGPPARTARALVTVELDGDPNEAVDPHSFAEFRAVETWDAPPVTVSGPPHNLVWAPGLLDASLAVRLPDGAVLAAELVDLDGRAVRSWPAATGGRLTIQADQPPGYYELRWQVHDAGGRLLRDGAEPYAVLSAAERPADTPFGMDAGFAWSIIQRGEAEARDMAELLARLGLRTVRDRFSVRQTYREAGRLELGRYADAARIQREAGLRVYTVFHDLPPFLSAAPDDPASWQAPAGDLREVYRFFTLAARATGRDIAAWELWNEPDIPMFFAGRPEEYAAILKAGYLGLKAGNPGVNALFCSPAHPLGEWLELVFACGAADYYDTFNWHTYHPYHEIPSLGATFRDAQIAHGYDAPMWLTETGSVAEATLEDERRQAADYAKRYVLAALSRIERVFAFYFQEWRQRGAPAFGIVRPDLTPRPALAALSALTEQLGAGEPLGEEPGTAPARVVWFDSGDGPVAVAWSETPAPLPAHLAAASCVSMVGTPMKPPAELGPQPIYLRGVAPPADLVPPPPPPARRARDGAAIEQLGMVLDCRLAPADDPPLGSPERKLPARVAPGDRLPAEVSVYNFTAREARVRLSLEVPAGWRLDGLAGTVTVPPGGRVRQDPVLVVGRLEPGRQRSLLRLAGETAGYRIAPVVIATRPATERIPLERVAQLGALPEARERWTVGRNEPVELILGSPPGQDERLRVSAQLGAPAGDRWGFANLALTPREALSAGDGLRFRYQSHEPWAEELLVILFEQDGSQYLAHAGRLADVDEHAVRLFWSDFSHNAGVSAEENDRLDLDQVDRIGFGFSARGAQTAGGFDLWELELVRIGGGE